MLRFAYTIFAIALIVAAPARAAMEDYPSVKLQGLDKSTARTTTFEAKVGSTITYGPLFIRIQSCRKAPPIEKPESAAFVQIWEVPPETGKSEWVFSGWMFASSPALSAMDHPVYDIWVLDCSGREEPNEEAKQSESDAATASQDDLAAPTGEGAASETATPAASDSEAPAVDSEAQDQTPVDGETATDANDATAPATPAPGTPFDPAVDPDAPYVPAPLPNQMPAPAQPDAPYVPAPLPTPQVTPDYDAPYSPNRAYPPQ